MQDKSANIGSLFSYDRSEKGLVYWSVHVFTTEFFVFKPIVFKIRTFCQNLFF